MWTQSHYDVLPSVRKMSESYHSWTGEADVCDCSLTWKQTEGVFHQDLYILPKFSCTEKRLRRERDKCHFLVCMSHFWNAHEHRVLPGIKRFLHSLRTRSVPHYIIIRLLGTMVISPVWIGRLDCNNQVGESAPEHLMCFFYLAVFLSNCSQFKEKW